MSTARQRLPLARHRLLRSDFERLYRRGRRAQGEGLAVVVLENDLGRARLGLSVAKRHFKRAVERNRARRALREAFRLARAELPAGIDVVLIATAPARYEVAELVRALPELVGRALRKKPRAPEAGAR